VNQEDRQKGLVLSRVDDLVADFLYYGRKEDKELPRGMIEDLLDRGVLTREEIVERFRLQLVGHT
jgi:hypothetical protein